MSTETATPETTRTPGQRAYEAYFTARDGDAGCWDDLTGDQQACWEAAGSATTTDMIVRWDEVRTGDLVLNYHGEVEPATVMPQGNAWQLEGCVSIMIGGSWFTPRKDKLTAVRRPALDEAGKILTDGDR